MCVYSTQITTERAAKKYQNNAFAMFSSRCTELMEKWSGKTSNRSYWLISLVYWYYYNLIFLLYIVNITKLRHIVLSSKSIESTDMYIKNRNDNYYKIYSAYIG